MGFLVMDLLGKIFGKKGAKGGCAGGDCSQPNDNVASNMFRPGGCCSNSREMKAATQCMQQGGDSTCLPDVTIG